MLLAIFSDLANDGATKSATSSVVATESVPTSTTPDRAALDKAAADKAAADKATAAKQLLTRRPHRSWARPFGTENSPSPSPQSPAESLK